MIYPRHSGDADYASGGRAAALVPRLLRELSDLFGDGPPLREAEVEAVARAVDAVLERPAAGADDETRVVMLTSQALASLGEQHTARRLLVYGTGLVRPAVWEMSAGASMWVLDLRRFTAPSEAPLELLLFRCLDAVITATAEVWDRTRGEGVLGLRHVCRTAAGLLNRGTHTPAAHRLAEELRAHAADRLTALHGRRCWLRAPAVVNLDF